MKAKPNVNFTLESNRIVLKNDLKQESKKRVNMSTLDVQQLFHWHKKDVNFDTRKITEFIIWSRYKEITFPMEFDDFKRKEARLDRSWSPPISIKVVLFWIFFFLITWLVIELGGYV